MQNRDRVTDRVQADNSHGSGWLGVERSSKKGKELMDMDNIVVFAGGRRVGGGRRRYKGDKS